MILYATRDTRGEAKNKVAIWHSKPDLMDGQWFRGDVQGMMRPIEFEKMFKPIPDGKCIAIHFNEVETV